MLRNGGRIGPEYAKRWYDVAHAAGISAEDCTRISGAFAYPSFRYRLFASCGTGRIQTGEGGMMKRLRLPRWRHRRTDAAEPRLRTPEPVSTTAEGSAISSDRPIQHPDEDRFGIDPFAQMVARSVAGQQAAEGTVLAVNGPWGSGKSSAVNLVLHHLRETSPGIEIVPFNPWWFSGSPALARAFFSTIASALGRTLTDEGRAALDGFLGRLGDLNTYTETAARVAEKGVGGGLAYFALGDRSLEEEHAKIAAALRQHEKSFLVVVDDIDRLSPDEALLVFGLVKSFGRLPHVTYLLAFDRILIERLLDERFPSEGGQYLEKILQAVFDLPPIPPEILREIFLEELGDLFDVSDAEMVRFMNLFYDTVVPNLFSPRNVIRLAGSLRVTAPAVKEEVDAADFMSIETLRLFWPAVYRNVRDHQEMACNGIGLHAYANTAQRKADVEAALLKDVPEAHHPYVKTSLQRLFPRLEGVWSNVNYGHDWDGTWDLARRVCNARHLPTYFQYAVHPDALPNHIREDLVARAADQDWIKATLRDALAVRRRNGGTQAALLLDELNLLAERIPLDQVAPLLSALFEIADELDRSEDEGHGFNIGSNPLRVHWLLNRLILNRFSLEERSKLLLATARQAAPGWWADLAERCLRPYQQQEGEGRRDRDEPLVDEPTARQMADLARERLWQAAEDGSLLAAHGAHSMLWALYRLTQEEPGTVRAFTDAFLEDDDQTVRLTEALTSVSWSQGMGFAGMSDRVAQGRPRVQRRGLEKIIDADRLHARVTALLAQPDLSDESRQILERFLAGWEANLED